MATIVLKWSGETAGPGLCPLLHFYSALKGPFSDPLTLDLINYLPLGVSAPLPADLFQNVSFLLDCAACFTDPSHSAARG